MPTHIPQATRIEAAGRPPNTISEYFGRVHTGHEGISIAHMRSPEGWSEPGQTPEFREYTAVLSGTLRVEHHGGLFDVRAGEGVLAEPGEWVRYSTPFAGGAEYVAVCVPAFSP